MKALENTRAKKHLKQSLVWEDLYVSTLNGGTVDNNGIGKSNSYAFLSIYQSCIIQLMYCITYVYIYIHTSMGSVSFTRTVNTVLWVEMKKSCVMKLSTYIARNRRNTRKCYIEHGVRNFQSTVFIQYNVYIL